MTDFWSPVASGENPFEGVVVVIRRTHIWHVGGEAYGQVLPRDLVMELVAERCIRICKTPRTHWGLVLDPDVVIGRTRLMTWEVVKMKK